MKENSRTKNSIINSSVSIITQLLTVIINFIVKTVFIKTLGNEYNGISGLFTNIITMLSLADLGIGLAIPYSLYRPLAEKDNHKIKVLINFYKKVYTTIGIIVLIVGILITPFLDLFIKEMPDIPYLWFIYILYVVHSASSYFFVYKKFLIDSDQRSYITSRITFISSTILSIVQIIILITLKSYILFLLSSIFFVIIQNIYMSHVANKMYPFIKEKTNEKIDKEDMDDIKKNISALFIYKVGNVISNGTDNIVISKALGIIIVGFYNNYLLIVNSITNVMNQLFNAITSSIGNLVVTTNAKRSKDVYMNLNFMNFWLYGLCGICLLVLINPFIKLWLGEKYLFSFDIILVLIVNFYVAGMQSVTTSFRNAYGLFWKAKFRPIVMIIINLVISIILVKFIGVLGVLLGTLISRLTTTAWLDPYIVHKYGFKQNSKDYYLKYILYFIIFLVTGLIVYYLSTYIIVNNIIVWVLEALVTFIFVNLIFILIFRKTSEFNYFYEKLKNFLNTKIRHN